MERLEEWLDKYAELAVKSGVNLHPGQTLIIRSAVAAAPFVRKLVRKAYEQGAYKVHVEWSDDEVSKAAYELASLESLQDVPKWRVQGLTEMAESGAPQISIDAPNPGVFKGLDSERMSASRRAHQQAMKKFNQFFMSDRNAWSVIAYATEEWAKLVFPDLDVQAAVERLWQAIFEATRLDKEDPVAAWEAHLAKLKARLNYLNTRKFKRLLYSAPGTNLSIDLPEGHLWLGGGATTPTGVFFLPNMPTEEVFTVPSKYGVNGTVTSTTPLDYAGTIIQRFTLTFKDGRIVDVSADNDEDVLRKLIETDEGAHYLGEVALVPNSSPIAQSGIVFRNTLFDENAASHIAIGDAYPVCLEGGTDMTEQELEAKGVNSSLTHVDFMIGSASMDIDGITAEGETVPIMRRGEWATEA